MLSTPSSIGKFIGSMFLILAAILFSAVNEAQASDLPNREAEITAALYAASATQAASERALNHRIREQQRVIEQLQAQVASSVEAERVRPQLTAAQEQLIADLAERDQRYAREIAAFRGVIEGIAASPEGLRALELFNEGERSLALFILDELRRDNSQSVSVATEVRRVAQMALEARAYGDATTDDVIDRYETVVDLDPGEPRDWLTLAELYSEDGEPDRSRRAAEQAIEISGDALVTGDAYAFLGAAAELAGDQEQSRNLVGHGLTVVEQAITRDSDNGELLYLKVRLGNILGGSYVQSSTATALRTLNDIAVDAELMIRMDDENDEWQAQRSLVYQSIGEAHFYSGNFHEMERAYRRALEIAEFVRAMAPDVLSWIYLEGIATIRIADAIRAPHLLRTEPGTAQNSADMREVQQLYRMAQQLIDELIQVDPRNTKWSRTHARLLHRRGETQRMLGDFAGAARYFEQSSEAFRRITYQSDNDSVTLLDLANSEMDLGHIYWRLGDTRRGLQIMQSSELVILELLESDAQNFQWRVLLANLNDRIGNVYRQANDLNSARRSYQISLETRISLYRDNPDNGIIERDLMSSYQNMGNVARDRRRYYLQAYEIGLSLRARGRLTEEDEGEMLFLENYIRR